MDILHYQQQNSQDKKDQFKFIQIVRVFYSPQENVKFENGIRFLTKKNFLELREQLL